MQLSRQARLIAGVISLTVPTIMYGGLTWLARISAPVAAVGIAGGFFGIAFLPAFRWLLYFGAASLAVTVILIGIGLVWRDNGGVVSRGGHSAVGVSSDEFAHPGESQYID